MRKYLKVCCFLVVLLSTMIAVPHSAYSIDIIDAGVAVTGLDPVSSVLVKMLLHQILDDNRGAASAAVVNGEEDKAVGEASFFESTGLVEATVANTGGSALAVSQNSLTGKIVYANAEAFDEGDSAEASAALKWKGQTKFQQESQSTKQGEEGGDDKAVELPLPEEVAEAFLEIEYAIGGIELSISASGAGSVSMYHYWNDILAIEGSVQLVENGLPDFTGDFDSISEAFTTSATEIGATDLVLTDTVKIPIDYSDFYNSGIVTANFSGGLDALANSAGSGEDDNGNDVAEPSTIILFGSGFIGLAVFRRKISEKIPCG